MLPEEFGPTGGTGVIPLLGFHYSFVLSRKARDQLCLFGAIGNNNCLLFAYLSS